MSRLTWDGTAETVSPDQVLRRERGQGNINFLCLADHEQDWQPYPVDPSLAIRDDHTCIHAYGQSMISGRNPPPCRDTKKAETKDTMRLMIYSSILLHWV